MKLKLVPRTNVEEALLKNKSRQLNNQDHEVTLKELYRLLDIKQLNRFDFDRLDTDKIFHINHIKAVCIDFRLRFLDLKYFKNQLPPDAINAIRSLEAEHDTRLDGFKIMAPSVLFRLEKTDDPLLFVPLGNNYYYLIHKWGNDLSPFRRLLVWPFKNIWNLLILILGLSFIVTELTPMALFTKTPDTSTYWMLLFFVFKAIASIVLFYGFALGKNFNPAIWNSRYNKS
ncbi:MAG: hypothetical protein VW080_10550 [Flavobacteriaceae bacterium]